MKGNNTILLNHDSMVEALQVWADAIFREKVIVRGITSVHESKLGVKGFEITLSGSEPAVQKL